MDKIDICKGVELCLDASNIYILNDGKRKDLTNKSGKVLNSLYYLFGQYLEEHEISFDFKDNLDMIGISNINVMSKQFMNLHILENNHDGRVLSDCGNNLVEKIIGYVSENSGVYDSIKNLRYLGLFDKCQNLIGDGGCEELNPDTKIFDTYPEDTIDSAPVSPVAEMLIDESVVTDPVDDVDSLPVDQTEAEVVIVPVQGEIDASVYPLSHEEIKLAIGRDILVWDGDRLVVTDEGRKHEIFMILYGDKIDALNNSDVSDVPEEVLYTEDLDKAYYSIAERTDKYEGVSIFFEGNEVPIVTLKIYDEGKKMLLSPQIYALNIICMADKLGVELTKDLLEDKLELFAYSSAKHWASLLEVDGCITYDDGILKPGQKLRDVVDLANTYIEGKYESFEEPIQIKYVPYPRIKKLLTHKDIFSISGDQTVLGIKDRASNNSGVQFSDSKPIHRPRDNKQGNFNRSADKPEGISGIESNNGDLTITYYGHDGSGADKESLPVKRLQVNDTLTPAGERINMDNGNSADSIVDALKEFKLLDSIGDLNEYGELLSKKMNMDWNSIL
ncbi:MAG: hypothetical protein KAS11_01100 [Candidatus Aenigmarchaeota archaeon]|nr:hypothetical protein [Candidatus Aenigmarchaeota archaeon]